MTCDHSSKHNYTKSVDHMDLQKFKTRQKSYLNLYQRHLMIHVCKLSFVKHNVDFPKPRSKVLVITTCEHSPKLYPGERLLASELNNI